MSNRFVGAAALAVALPMAACQPPSPETSGGVAREAPPKLSAEDFVAEVNKRLDEIGSESGAAGWVQSTYIIEDTARIRAKARERYLKFHSDAVQAARAYADVPLDAATARALKLLTLDTSMPAPDDEAKRSELAAVATRMPAVYGAGKYCREDGECRDLGDLEEILARSRDYAELEEAWLGWRTVAPEIRDDYARFVELANEGARQIGFSDLGEMWRSGYDMDPEAFRDEIERLWRQVSPLYEALHCHVRAKLGETYGTDSVPQDGPIPAHLFGNMWSQNWGQIYSLLEPYPEVTDLDISGALVEQGYTARQMTESAEDFFVSLGMPELPDTFWERSMLTKPADREAICHASAWTVLDSGDVRIKMCIDPTEEDLTTIYHELGHIYYYLAYEDEPNLYRAGAHDGFHEAIGDAVTLSMTPAFLQDIGLVGERTQGEEATINTQMKMALDKIAFLPFGKLIDQWRWDVFAGRITPANYNEAWWELRTKYQGIVPPVLRTEADFDPGAKYHIPANTPYARYFLSFLLQFQFQQALCEAAGHEGPLHECSVYGSEAAGEKLWALLAAGASEPWPLALEKLTGTREMDAGAIIDYFAPLMAWLKEQNEGRTCGW